MTAAGTHTNRPMRATLTGNGPQVRCRAPRVSLPALAATAVLGLASIGSSAADGDPRRPWLECRSAVRNTKVASAAAMTPGTLLLATQDPPVVHHGYDGTLRFRDIAVLGDFETVDFQIDALSGPTLFSVERQERFVSSLGEVVSLFEVEGTLQEWVSLPWNWDIDVASPVLFTDLLYLGPSGNQRPIYMPLTVLPRSLPRSKVVRVDARLQYASNVVNVAVPDFLERQLEQPGGAGYTPEEVIRTVEELLGPGPYDEYGFGLWHHQMTHPGAFHQNNQQGEPSYSSFTSAAIPVQALWQHEINHNWNFRYDLPGLVGWEAPFDGFHSRGTVAEEPGFLCCGAYPVRRIAGKWRTTWIRDPHPFHPLELFAMGLVGREEVPELRVFKRQDLPDHRPGEVMRGPSRQLIVDRVIEEYGQPEPAASRVWRVAPVIVSDRLLPKKILSKLNFYMRRIEDPDGTVPGSFDRLTGGRMDLQTTIATGGRRSARAPRRVAYPEIGTREIPGVSLERPLLGCLEVGEALVIEGRTALGTVPDVALVPSNPDSERVEVAATPLSGGRFRAVLTPAVEDLHRVVIGPVLPTEGTDRRRSKVDLELRPGQVRFGPIYVTSDCSVSSAGRSGRGF